MTPRVNRPHLRTGPPRGDYDLPPNSCAARVMRKTDELGLSAAEASRAAGLAPTFIRDLYRERAKHPRIDCVEKLATLFKVTPEWLAWGVGDANALPRAAAASRRRSNYRTLDVAALRKSFVSALRAARGSPQAKVHASAEILVDGLIKAVEIPEPAPEPSKKSAPVRPKPKPRPKPLQ